MKLPTNHIDARIHDISLLEEHEEWVSVTITLIDIHMIWQERVRLMCVFFFLVDWDDLHGTIHMRKEKEREGDIKNTFMCQT